jgi:hypothetical protein
VEQQLPFWKKLLFGISDKCWTLSTVDSGHCPKERGRTLAIAFQGKEKSASASTQ